MNVQEAAAVLAKAAGYDNRTVGRANVMAWHEALHDLDIGDCLDAVTQHHRESSDYLMPVHIRRLATKLRAARREVLDRENRKLELETYAAVSGPLTDRSEEVRELVSQIRDVLPEGEARDLFPRREHWRREQRRQAHAEPNPEYDPTMGPVATWQASKHPPRGAWWENPVDREAHSIELLADAGRLTRKRRNQSSEEAW